MPHYIDFPAAVNEYMRSCTPHTVVTRFAPSPNGQLHLGHAYAAICAHDFARAAGGRFQLRIEDIDGTRSRADHIDNILADLRWLDIIWDDDVIFQSHRTAAYHNGLLRLRHAGLIYRCFCSRGDIATMLKQQPVHHGPDGPHYPGTCRSLGAAQSEERSSAEPYCWRLDMAAATRDLPPLSWHDLAAGAQYADPNQFGDVILWRKDTPASYHLAATLDDGADGINMVVRGQDLFAYSHIHRLLQHLLDLPTPIYWHHPLAVDQNGEKLAKSRASPSLSVMRVAGDDGKILANAIRNAQLPLGISHASP